MSKKKNIELTNDQYYYYGMRGWSLQISRSYKQLKMFQMLSVLGLIGFLFSTYMWMEESSKPKLLPYMYSIDVDGNAKFAGMLSNQKLTVNDALMISTIKNYITLLREVSTDRVILQRNLTKSYFFSNENTQVQITSYIKNEETSPFALVKTETRRDLRFTHFEKIHEKTWRAEWIESYRVAGNLTGEKRMSGVFTYHQKIPSNQNAAEINPAGIIFEEFNIQPVREANL